MITVKHANGWAAVLGLSALLGTGTASAHIKLKSPTSRDPNNPLKSAPCGPNVSMRGSTMTMFTSGQKIMVEWDETIQHPGHYRIAFDDDGQDFPDPTSFTDIATANKDLGNGVVVLLDGIADTTKKPYTAEVTLPDIECANCTLQLIQVMTDKSPYGNGDDIYHECANLVLKKAGGAAAGSGAAGAAAGAGAGAGGAAGAAAGSGAAGSGRAGSSAGGAGANAAGVPVSSAAGAGVAAAGSGVATGAAGSVGMTLSPAATAGSSAIAGAPAATPSASDSGCTVARAGAERDVGAGAAACFAFACASLVVGIRMRRRARSLGSFTHE